jgi:hypothetical protein
MKYFTIDACVVRTRQKRKNEFLKKRSNKALYLCEMKRESGRGSHLLIASSFGLVELVVEQIRENWL